MISAGTFDGYVTIVTTEQLRQRRTGRVVLPLVVMVMMMVDPTGAASDAARLTDIRYVTGRRIPDQVRRYF